MNARMRRLMSDYEQVKKDFAGHKHIQVKPVGTEPPEKYQVTYFVNGIYLLPDGRIETQGRHEVEITLHADYPRYKPICKINTPIWHPNFRDGQICIGDIWGAGESLTDIIINIGDMIQYKSWNSSSPLSADAAEWAIKNKHLFPVGNLDLFVADYASAKDIVEIDMFDEDDNVIASEENDETNGVTKEMTTEVAAIAEPVEETNDFDITAEELAGIEFVPTAQRMQAFSGNNMVKGNKINLKTVVVKGILWAIIGAILGFGVSELMNGSQRYATAATISGHSEWVKYFEYQEKSDELYEEFSDDLDAYCKKNDLDREDDDALSKWINEADEETLELLEKAENYQEKAKNELYEIYVDEYDSDMDDFEEGLEEVSAQVGRIATAIWSAILALFIGLFLGIGEGVFYGSSEKAVKYGLLGAVISFVSGAVSGYLAQWMYASMLSDNASDFAAAFIRGLGWAVMGLGVGFAVGVIKPQIKRIVFCSIGGVIGAFIGGFAFNYVTEVIPDDMVARGVAIVIMGLLIGVGVGLLEQFAKQAWLKVIRGEFEGKEYLVFAGTTSIGNNGKNTIVLFKDKLVGPHHCDIVLEGSKYVLIDRGTPMGTVVNGTKTARHVLKQGDAIAIGNSVLVFNTK